VAFVAVDARPTVSAERIASNIPIIALEIPVAGILSEIDW
jgi:hypothetical protein